MSLCLNSVVPTSVLKGTTQTHAHPTGSEIILALLSASKVSATSLACNAYLFCSEKVPLDVMEQLLSLSVTTFLSHRCLTKALGQPES